MDQPEPYQLDNIIIARAVEVDASPRKELNFLVSDTAVIKSPVKALKTQFESSGYIVSLCSLWDLPSSSVDVLSLLDIDGPQPFFQGLSQKNLQGLIRFISHFQKRKILWITGPAQISVQNPYFAMILGFARTLRLEMGTTFATMELDVADNNQSLWNSVIQVFTKIQGSLGGSYNNSDSEYAFVNGTVCVPRFTTSSVKTIPSSSLAMSQKIAKKLHISKPGILSSLQWALQFRDVMQANEVEIEVRVSSVNSRVFIPSSLIESSNL